MLNIATKKQFCLCIKILCLICFTAALSPVVQPALCLAEEGVSTVETPAIATTFDPAKEVKETASLAIALLKVAGSLLLVVGLMLLLMQGIKKLGLGGAKLKPSSLISILDTRMIAPKKYVAVLEVAEEFVLVGITDQQINLLTKLEKTESLNKTAKQSNQAENIAAPFASIFNKAVNGIKKSKSSTQ